MLTPGSVDQKLTLLLYTSAAAASRWAERARAGADAVRQAAQSALLGAAAAGLVLTSGGAAHADAVIRCQ